MVICSVFGCKSSNYKKQKENCDTDNKQIKFFRFPKNAEYNKIWVAKTCRSGVFNTKHAYICSKHFAPDAYMRNLKHELLDYSPPNSKKLKCDAVPTLCLPNAKNDFPAKNEERKARQDKRAAKKIVLSLLNDNNNDKIDCGMDQSLNSTLINDQSTSFSDPNATLFVDQSTSTPDLNEIESKKSAMVHKKLLKENKTLLKKCHQLQKENDCIKNIFTPVQRKKLQSVGKRLRWDAEDISRAIAIYAAGPKAYRFLLKKGYPFPAVSTLKTWASKVDINPGYLNVVFKLMESCNLTPYQRVCVIMADEMKIQGSFEYESDTLLPPASYVQVCMVRGLFENWFQPVFYSYNCQLTEDIVNNIISKLHKISFHVVAMVSDLGGGNRGLWKNLNINETTPYFINPSDETKKELYLAMFHT